MSELSFTILYVEQEIPILQFLVNLTWYWLSDVVYLGCSAEFLPAF